MDLWDALHYYEKNNKIKSEMRQRYEKSAFFAKKACNTVFFLFKGMSELKECVTCCCLEHDGTV